MASKKSASQWSALFKEVDKDNNGYIDVHEMATLLRRNNCKLPDSYIAETFIMFDGPQGDRRITLEEFSKGMDQVVRFIEELTKLFNQYDADKSGFLDKNELRKLLHNCGNHKFTDPEVEQILRDADSSGDGKISFREFLDACS